MSKNIKASYDESLGLWENFDNDENLLDNSDHHQSMIDDVVSDDFLMMEVEVDLDDHASEGGAHGSHDDNWDLNDDGGADANHRANEKLPSFNDDGEDEDDSDSDDEDYEDDDDTPRTPSQGDRQVFLFKSENVHEITPEQQVPTKINLPDLADLQLHFQRTMKKLAKSMRRSDETRLIVKRQRLQSPLFKDEESDSDFFPSYHANAMEESRQKLYQMINIYNLQ